MFSPEIKLLKQVVTALYMHIIVIITIH